jgi:hypothetical protein
MVGAVFGEWFGQVATLVFFIAVAIGLYVSWMRTQPEYWERKRSQVRRRRRWWWRRRR